MLQILNTDAQFAMSLGTCREVCICVLKRIAAVLLELLCFSVELK